MNRIAKVDTGSVDLDRDVLYINDQIKAGRKSSHEVAKTLLKIRTEGLFTVCSDTFSNFCSDYFGINKATGSKLCTVAERFLTDDTYADYSISKLMEMRGATSEQLALIKPEMTVAQIRDVLNPKPALEDKSKDKTEDKTEDTAESCDVATEDTEDKDFDVETVKGKGKELDKIVGKGFIITVGKDGKYKSAETASVDGMLALIKYLTKVSNSLDDKYTDWDGVFTTTLNF